MLLHHTSITYCTYFPVIYVMPFSVTGTFIKAIYCSSLQMLSSLWYENVHRVIWKFQNVSHCNYKNKNFVFCISSHSSENILIGIWNILPISITFWSLWSYIMAKFFERHIYKYEEKQIKATGVLMNAFIYVYFLYEIRWMNFYSGNLKFLW